MGARERETSPRGSWATRNDGAALLCPAAKEKEQSSLLYSSDWRAKLSHFPFALGTSPAHHRSLLQKLTKPAEPWQLCWRREEQDKWGYAVCCIRQVLCPQKWEREDRSNQLTSLPVFWACVSGMGLTQTPCSSSVFNTRGESRSPPLC